MHRWQTVRRLEDDDGGGTRMSRQLVPQLVTEDEQTRALRLEVRDFLRQEIANGSFEPWVEIGRAHV